MLEVLSHVVVLGHEVFLGLVLLLFRLVCVPYCPLRQGVSLLFCFKNLVGLISLVVD